MNFDGLMEELSKRRPIFHSEADFQFSVAWLAQEKQKDANVRLECRPNYENSEYVDILIKQPDNVFIELKYRTKLLTTKINDEQYALRSQGAQDAGRYYFLKDVKRLEQFVRNGGRSVGFAVLLTNDPKFWESPQLRLTEPNDLNFRIHEGKIITGPLNWRGDLSESMRAQFPDFCLRETYKAIWKDYSRASKEGNGQFRYLMFKIVSQV